VLALILPDFRENTAILTGDLPRAKDSQEIKKSEQSENWLYGG
jgi:hypothetical protein